MIEKFKSLDSSFFIKFIYFIFGCASLSCCTDSSCGESGPYSVIVVCGLLIPVASVIVEHGRSAGAGPSGFAHMGSAVAALRFWSMGSIVVAHRLHYM